MQNSKKSALGMCQLKFRELVWENVNEVIAAKIAYLLHLPYLHAEIAFRHRQRGCLMVHLVNQLSADFGEVDASLLMAQFDEVY